MSPYDYRKTIFILDTVLNPCFDVGLSSGQLRPRLSLFPTLFPFSLTFDRRTKINIVDDENKTLDTGSTGRVLTLSPSRLSFSERSRISCIDMTIRACTHTRARARARIERYVELNGSICIFYKLDVIHIAGRSWPMLVYMGDRVHRRVSVGISVHWPIVDLSSLRIAPKTTLDQARWLEYAVNPPIYYATLIHR